MGWVKGDKQPVVGLRRAGELTIAAAEPVAGWLPVRRALAATTLLVVMVLSLAVPVASPVSPGPGVGLVDVDAPVSSDRSALEPAELGALAPRARGYDHPSALAPDAASGTFSGSFSERVATSGRVAADLPGRNPQFAPGRTVRDVGADEDLWGVFGEMATRQRDLGVEHALVRGGSGDLRIVSGGRQGFTEIDDLAELVAHTHPGPDVLPGVMRGPSPADVRTVQGLGQDVSVLTEPDQISVFGPGIG